MKHLWRRFDIQVSELARFPIVSCRLRQWERRATSHAQRPVETGTLISLTTFPQRAETVQYTLRSLLCQEVLPEKIVLVLARDEFVGVNLPERLQSMVQGRLEILEIERSFRSYNKLIPVLERYPDHTIVTADDDKIYAPGWFGSLIEASKAEPGTIICHCARELPLYRADQYPEYHQWDTAGSNVRATALLPLGVCGILYPPGSLHADCTKSDLFMSLSPRADDMWLRFMSLRKNTPVRRLDRYSRHPEAVPTPWNMRLSHGNVLENDNVESYKSLMAKYGPELQKLGIVD